jgi:putative CocE/NonD family hydrolase
MRAYSSLAGYVCFLPVFGYSSSSTCWTPYYLHVDGLLSLEKANESDTFLSYQHDARYRVPAVGVSVDPWGVARALRSGESCPPCAPLPDVLVFDTSPLTQDVEVTGPIKAVLWISSDSLDTDFNFKLIDVYPPNVDYPQGFALHLTEDVFHRRHPDSQGNPSPLQSNEIYRIRAEALPLNHIFKQGHRIRITISSRCLPRAVINSRGRKDGGTAHSGAAVANRLYLDKEYASHIVLPLISHRNN